MSLIAVNLPSLWFLLSQMSRPESFFRSMQRLGSQGSRASPGSSKVASWHARGSTFDKYSRPTSSSEHAQLPIHSAEEKSVEAYVMHGKDEESPPPSLPEGKIGVTDRISQTSRFA